MENEIIEEIILENTEVSMENPSDPTDVPSDILSDTEIVETLPETTPDLVPDENIPDSPILEETESLPETEIFPESETTPEEILETETTAPEEIPENEITAPEEIITETSIPEIETGETENANITEMDNGYENFYNTVPSNDIGDGGSTSPVTGDTYVTYNYTMEQEEIIPLWENNISNFSTSEMLLFLIFLLLLVQFIHNLFKGSHWLKG